MTILDVLDEVTRQYDVDSYTIVSCLKRAVRDELGLGEVFDSYKDGKLDLFEKFIDQNGKEKTRRVKITQKRLNYVRDRLYKYIIEENTKERLEIIKKNLSSDKVIRGKIISKNEYGLEISTKYGKAFAPNNLLNPKEVEEGKYKVEADLNFHIYKLGIKKNKINIDTGVISMNKMLVDTGILFIRTHPAPKAKPWVIMGKDDQEGFKSMLVYYDKKMDEDVDAIEKAVVEKDWMKALEASQELSNSCISCHTAYKDKVQYVMK